MQDLFRKYDRFANEFMPTLFVDKKLICASTAKKICKMLFGPQESELACEMAVNMDYSPPFVTATYFMEGDRFLSIFAYNQVEQLRTHISTFCAARAPHLVAVAEHRARGDGQLKQALITAALAKMEASTEYFLKVFHPRTGRMATAMEIFKAARWFDPLQVPDFDVQNLGQLLRIPSIVQADSAAKLAEEYPAYLTAAKALCAQRLASNNDDDHVSFVDFDRLQWFKKHREKFPTWALTACDVALILVSSAADERVFSFLRQMFDCRQESAKEDYVETAVILAYNEAKGTSRATRRQVLPMPIGGGMRVQLTPPPQYAAGVAGAAPPPPSPPPGDGAGVAAAAAGSNCVAVTAAAAARSPAKARRPRAVAVAKVVAKDPWGKCDVCNKWRMLETQLVEDSDFKCKYVDRSCNEKCDGCEESQCCCP